jgi:hypothetical protein
VTDVSWHGCFVQSVYAPEVGSQTLVTITFGDDRISLVGVVRYVELRMGFAVQFDAITDAQAKALIKVVGHPSVAVARS